MLAAHPEKPDAAAIVNMENPEQAKWLIDNVSGKVPQGLAEPLTIKQKNANDWSKGYGKGGMGGMPPWAMMQMMQMYKGKGKGGGKGWGGGGGGLSSFPAEKKVWVGGLPEGEAAITFKELQEHFPGSKFATAMKGKGAGTGGVAYATAEEATEAIQTLNGSVLAGVTIEVDVWTKKADTEQPTA